MEMADQLVADIESFRANGERLVMVWCGSTEAYLEPQEVHRTWRPSSGDSRDNDPAIAPSQVYAYAAIRAGVPFANGAPNLSVDIPALVEMAETARVSDRRQGLQDGPDPDEDDPGSGLKSRALGIAAGSPRTSSATATASARPSRTTSRRRKCPSSACSTRCSSRDRTRPLRRHHPRGADQLLPAARRRQRGLGQHRHLRMARLSDADQGRLPMSRQHPGGPDRARPGSPAWTWRTARARVACRSG